jgi:hypothetical protein
MVKFFSKPPGFEPYLSHAWSAYKYLKKFKHLEKTREDLEKKNIKNTKKDVENSKKRWRYQYWST